MQNILILLNSFKDVFTPEESLQTIKQALLDVDKNIHVKAKQICDGGEYCLDVVQKNFNHKIIKLENIKTPYKHNTFSKYLMLDNETSFISSSQILRIEPKFDEFKNPLYLTSFGLGEKLKHAINSGAKSIYIGLGGTNTVDCGVGMLQALGVRFLDENGKILVPEDKKYFSGIDLINIKKIDFDCVDFDFRKIKIFAVCDGNSTICDMDTPSRQKIGQKFHKRQDEILEKLHSGVMNFSKIIQKHNFYKDIKNMPFYGVAGGINLALDALFSTKMILGSEYFAKELKIEQMIEKSDLIITGEGKLDNSLCGKIPIGISKIAKKYDKKVLYIVGNVDEKLKDMFKGNIALDLPYEFKEKGVWAILSCHEFYNNKLIPKNQDEKKKLYKNGMRYILKKELGYLLKKAFA